MYFPVTPCNKVQYTVQVSCSDQGCSEVNSHRGQRRFDVFRFSSLVRDVYPGFETNEEWNHQPLKRHFNEGVQ